MPKTDHDSSVVAFGANASLGRGHCTSARVPSHWNDLPIEIRKRYERDLDGDQLAILQAKIPIDVLLDTNPDWLIRSWNQVETIKPDGLNGLLSFLSEWYGHGDASLEHATSFDRNLWGGADQVMAASRAIVARLALNSTTPLKLLDLQKHANVLLCNLYRACRTGKFHWIFYSRGTNYYSDSTTKSAFPMSRDKLIKLIDGLAGIGFVEKSGWRYDKDKGISRRSRMRPTWRFALWLRDLDISDSQVGLYKGFEPETTIVLRDQSGRPIPYKETQKLQRMKASLERYNRLLSQTDVTIPLDRPDDPLSEGSSCVQTALEYIDMSVCRYHRVFNNGSFKLGGRYYGPWVQQLPSELRKLIKINGNATVEPDYGSFDLHLLYSLEGLSYADFYDDGDPYYLDGTDRGILKQILIIILNLDTEKWTSNTIQNDLKKEGFEVDKAEILELIEAFKAKHHAISHHLYTGVGLRLQFLGSQVSTFVIKAMTKRKKPVLCIHDSFVCEAQHEQEVREVMIQAFHSCKFSSIPVIKTDA